MKVKQSCSVYEGVEKFDSYLEHHGIMGQKWGVRRFQNPDGSLTELGKKRYGNHPLPNERTVLKAGTRLNSVSPYMDSDAYKNSGRWTYLYDPNNEWDRSVYKGPFSKYKMQSTGYMMFEHSYEVVKDLKMPTSEERFDAFVELYEKNRKTFEKDLTSVQDVMKQYSMGPDMDDAKKVDLKKVTTDEDYVAAYKVFNHAMECTAAFESTKMYADLMATRYDAMVDDNNQGVYNDAIDPIIVFRGREALKSVSEGSAMSRLITMDMVNDNYWKVKNELAKRGENVKL